MTREQIERFVEALERLVRSDLVEIAGMWRRDIEELKATYRKIEEEGLHWERATEAAPERAAWVSPDPRLLFHLPLDLTCSIAEAAKRFLSGDIESLDRAFGLLRPPGHPIDPNKYKNFDLAETALTWRMQGKTWPEINSEVFKGRAEPPDERYIRTIVARYKLVVMKKWRGELHRRWLARSEEREKESILKNAKKGKNPDP